MSTSWQWRPQSVADLLDNTFRIYRAQFGRLFIVCAAILVPLNLFQAIFLPDLSMSSLLQLLAEMSPAQVDLLLADVMMVPDATAYIGGTFLFSALNSISYIVLVASVTWIADKHLHDELADMGLALQRGLQSFPRLFGIACLFAVLLFGLVLGLSVVGAIVGQVLRAPVAFLVLTVFAVFVLLLYFAMRWLFVTQATVIEKMGVFQAIRRSLQLSRGRTLRLFGRMFLFYVLSFVISAGAGALILALTSATVVFGNLQLTAVLVGLSTGLLGALFQSLLPIMITLLYYDMRVRQEGYDLEREAAQLEP